MDARRVGLTTLVALGAVAIAGSLVAGFAGVHAHGAGGLVWELGAILPFLAIGAYAYATRPDHPTTQRMAAVAALFALQSAFAPPVGVTPPDVTIPSDVVSFGREQLWIAYLGFHLLGMGLVIAAAWLFGLYPHGRLETTTERRLLRPWWAVLALPLLLLVGHDTLVPPSYEGEGAPSPTRFSSRRSRRWVAWSCRCCEQPRACCRCWASGSWWPAIDGRASTRASASSGCWSRFRSWS